MHYHVEAVASYRLQVAGLKKKNAIGAVPET